MKRKPILIGFAQCQILKVALKSLTGTAFVTIDATSLEKKLGSFGIRNRKVSASQTQCHVNSLNKCTFEHSVQKHTFKKKMEQFFFRS